MARPKKNIFASAVEERDKDQAQIEEKVVGPKEKPKDFKALAKEDKVSTTVVLSKANHLALKRCSVERGITFSEMINAWIERDCGEFLPKT